MELILLVVLWLGCMAACPSIARSKGRSEWGWFALAAVFGVLALLFVVVLPPHDAVAEGAASGPPAGWYDDPEVAGSLRWWDGQGWTDVGRPAKVEAR